MRPLLLLPLLITTASAADAVITYDEHIKPIFREHCLKCHGEDEQKADLNLANFTAVLKGGSGDKAVVAGRASTSLLFKAITAEDDAERMPPKKAAIPAPQIELIRQWIQGGLRESSASKSLVAARDTSFKAATALNFDGPPPMPESLPAFTPPQLKRPLPVIAMAASPRAPLIAVAGHEHVRLLDATTQQEIGALPFPEGQPNVIRFSRDGRVLMVAGGKPVQSGSVVLFEVKSGKRLTSVGDETDAVISADLSPDQKLIALGGSGKIVKVYGTDDGKLRHKLTKHTDWITALAFSPDGKSLASADRAGGIHLWDGTSGGILLTLAEHKAAVRALAWRSDSHMLASGGEDGLLIWWDTTDGWPAITNTNAHPPVRPAGYYGKLPNGVLALAFGPQGELLSAGRDKQVRLWAADGRALKSFASETALPLQTSITFDGKGLFAGDAAGAVRFWTTAN
ncbi:MAG: c-type cytochrome domain-containing protein [Prosthecobacter sp.]|uniref:c-type cytochrome domain-containing protein n=1 Tax=Prosthecobacter sp. TaxID=1965333 RepID=UPI0039027904